MNISEKKRMSGFTKLLITNGKDVESSNGMFRAVVSEEPEIDPGMELGEDLREVIVIDTLRNLVPKGIDAQQTVTVDGVDLALIRRIDNPSNTNVRFYAVKK